MKPDIGRNEWMHAAFRAFALAALLAAASAGAEADVPNNPKGGPAFGVQPFTASGVNPNFGRGFASMLETDLFGLIQEGEQYGDCNAVLVDIAHRANREAEIELSQSPLFDPATRIEKGQSTRVDFQIEGSVVSGGDDEGMSWSLQMRDLQTNEIVATDSGHSGWHEDGGVFELPVKIARRLLSAVCKKATPERTTWTVTRLAPYDEGAPAPGLYTVKVEMNKLRFECGKPDPVTGVGCDPLGTFTVTSQSGPSDGACSVRMEPSTLTVDVNGDNGRGQLQLSDYTDPKRDQDPGDYVGVVYVEWTAAEVCEKTGPNPCPCAGARTEQAMGRYVLLTGNAGSGKVTRDIKSISGRCAPAGGNQFGGACTGDKPVFEWTMTR